MKMSKNFSINWVCITPEYPPSVGGVADYTRLVATHLVKACQAVSVLAPTRGQAPIDNGLDVQPVLGEFGPIGFWRGSNFLDRIPRPRRLFLQWVPHGFGFKSMNLLLVVWIWWRVMVRRDQLWIMAHEPFFRFEKSWKQCVAGSVHRVMVWVLLACADQIFAGNRLWINLLLFWTPKGKPIHWLPVPSNVPDRYDPQVVSDIKKNLVPDGILVGSFGTFGPSTSRLLESCFKELLNKRERTSALFIGKNSDIFATSLIKKNPHFKGRIFGTGSMDSEGLSNHIAACDFFVQLNEEGLSTRNGSLMAILSIGKTGVGNIGAVTDSDWNSWKGFFVVKNIEVDR